MDGAKHPTGEGERASVVYGDLYDFFGGRNGEITNITEEAILIIGGGVCIESILQFKLFLLIEDLQVKGRHNFVLVVDTGPHRKLHQGIGGGRMDFSFKKRFFLLTITIKPFVHESELYSLPTSLLLIQTIKVGYNEVAVLMQIFVDGHAVIIKQGIAEN